MQRVINGKIITKPQDQLPCKEISKINKLEQFFPIQFMNYLRIRLKNYFSHLSQRFPCSLYFSIEHHRQLTEVVGDGVECIMSQN
jgi:hypothetical protein